VWKVVDPVSILNKRWRSIKRGGAVERSFARVVDVIPYLKDEGYVF
jgi:hypothetical protein